MEYWGANLETVWSVLKNKDLKQDGQFSLSRGDAEPNMEYH
jgi:hypothetical protein